MLETSANKETMYVIRNGPCLFKYFKKEEEIQKF